MPINKPTKPTNLMPTHFANNGIKNNFNTEKIENGFSANFDDILQGDNLNYVLDSVGKQLAYLNAVVDYINSIGINKVLYVNADNKLDSVDINGLLPSQTNNAGKYLTTNGTTARWSNDFRVIGEPIITLNFNYVLPSNCVWLDGTGGDNHNGVVPTTGEWADLFAIYGWQYDTSYTNTDNFKLPNFSNRVIWGGTSAGYIDAGLPDINFKMGGVEYLSKQADFWSPQWSMYKQNCTSGTSKDTDDDCMEFKQSRANAIFGNSSTVQPPAIKARVYTRYK